MPPSLLGFVVHPRTCNEPCADHLYVSYDFLILFTKAYVQLEHSHDNVGNAWATALMLTSFAAWDIILSFQSLHLFPNLSMIGWNLSFFILPSDVGMPKYLLSNEEDSMPKIILISSLTRYEQASVNKREHLLWLRSCQVHLWNNFSTSLILVVCTTKAFKKSMLPSAKTRFDIPGLPRAIFKGRRDPL